LSIPALDYQKYQAALVLPYYHVGSSNTRDLTVDDRDNTSRFSYQFYLKTHVPLMNVKLARTVNEQTQMTKDFFHQLTPPPAMAALLTQQPILIIRDEVATQDSAWLRSIPEPHRPFFYDALLLPERLQLVAIDSVHDHRYYEWYPLKD